MLSGFSQGSHLAAKTAWDGEVEAAGLILLAGPSPEAWSMSRARPVPSFIFVGAEDSALDGCEALAEALSRVGVPNVLDVRDGLGHELPEDLYQVIDTALNWIQTQG